MFWVRLFDALKDAYDSVVRRLRVSWKVIVGKQSENGRGNASKKRREPS